jgi:hypothetical protein
MSRAHAVLALAAGVLLAGCFSEHTAAPDGGPVSFASDVQPVFSGCAVSGCHGTQNTQPSSKPMVLSAGQAYDHIVNVSSGQVPSMDRIEPGNPNASYLIHKLQGTHTTVGGFGSRMPAGGNILPQTTMDMLRRWVTEGAQRN